MTIQLDLYPIDKTRDEHPCSSEKSCTRCGLPIVTITAENHVTSEYMDSEGRCWDCNRKARRPLNGGKRA